MLDTYLPPCKAIFILVVISISNVLHAQDKSNIVYGEVGERKLLLDLYLPASDNASVVLWVHGGAWHSGSKENPPLGLLEYGYAIASVDYRLSVEAPFPAMVHDIKAAVRFLRANGEALGIKSEKIVIGGASAGGHLAALVGSTNRHQVLEGTIGDFTNVNSDVQGVIDLYGPTNLLSILAQSTPHGIRVQAPALALLFGKPPEKAPADARLASPVFHVDASDPPFFIGHGDQDIQVPINQAHELVGKLHSEHVEVHFEIVHGAGHSSTDYYGSAFTEKIVQFLSSIL